MNNDSNPTDIPAEAKRYTIYVDDNYHYTDPSCRERECGSFTLEEAIIRCMAITEASFIDRSGKPGSYKGYTMFGEDPWITPLPDPKELAAVLSRHRRWSREVFENGYFSAWTYAAALERRHHRIRRALLAVPKALFFLALIAILTAMILWEKVTTCWKRGELKHDETKAPEIPCLGHDFHSRFELLRLAEAKP